MKIIQKLEVKNFKSFLEESLTFEDLTAIVGANESGKTNVLKAIHQFSKENLYKNFGRENGDFRLDSPDFPSGEIKLRVEFVLNKELIPELIKLEPKLEGKVFWFEKKGKLNVAPQISGGFSEKLSSVAGIMKVNNKGAVKTQLQSVLTKPQLDFIAAHGWLFKDTSINLSKNPMAALLKDKKIENLTEASRDEFLAEKVREEVSGNIKMLFWKYEEKDHYLPEKVSVAEFVADPSKFPGVDCMFAITGWKKHEYQNNLIDYDNTTRDQLLRSTQDAVNDLIKKHWTTHRELEVKLSFNGEFLDISLSEPGHETPPNFRSDGFKWFLSFLLFFKNHSSSLDGHILLVDEPGGFLHPQGQKDVLKELISLSSDNQVIYTTHQTFLINKNNPDSVRIIKREKRAKGKNAYDSRVYTLHDNKHILTDKLLRESLGFLVSDISPLNETNILVEGEFDRELLIEANRVFKIIDSNEVSIIGCGRASNISKNAALYIANGLKVVGLYDSDGMGKSAANAASGFEVVELQAIAPGSVVETMEDMVPDAVFNAGVAEWKKHLKLRKTFTATIPRMSQINTELDTVTDKTEKIDRKHLLEDCLIDAAKKALKSDKSQFSDLKKLLEKLKETIDKSA